MTFSFKMVQEVIKKFDYVSEPSCTNFQIRGDHKSGSVVGGIAYLICTVFLIRILLSNGLKLVNRESPSI